MITISIVCELCGDTDLFSGTLPKLDSEDYLNGEYTVGEYVTEIVNGHTWKVRGNKLICGKCFERYKSLKLSYAKQVETKLWEFLGITKHSRDMDIIED